MASDSEAGRENVKRLTRRDMLKLLSALGAGTLVEFLDRAEGRGARVVVKAARMGPDLQGVQQVAPTRPRVVHLTAPGATNWNYGADWFGDHIDQGVVNQMVDQGLTLLTGTASRAEAWQALIPGFVPGQRIAIKVNFNNFIGGDDQGAIDAVIEPVNALVAGLLEHGFAPGDIYVYDVTHAWHDGGIPPRFVAGSLYPGVQFVGYLDNPVPFSASERIHFNAPNPVYPIEDRPLAEVVASADYLINMPIVKSHPFSGVTLGFKNHFGSFDHCDYVHSYLPGYDDFNLYDPNYSPLVDVYLNPHIRLKTVLTVGDCLFGSWEDPITRPRPWATFGNGAPNSLFFGVDPVAIESVMTDILAAETALLPQTDDYLRLAEAAGLGVYERGVPWGSGYARIEYIRSGLASPTANVPPPAEATSSAANSAGDGAAHASADPPAVAEARASDKLPPGLPAYLPATGYPPVDRAGG